MDFDKFEIPNLSKLDIVKPVVKVGEKEVDEAIGKIASENVGTKTVTAKNIQGENDIGPIKNGEPILADDNITYYGQPVAVVLAKTFQEAQYASDLVKIEIDHLDDPILTLDDAYSKNSFHDDPIILEKGSVEKEMKKSNF